MESHFNDSLKLEGSDNAMMQQYMRHPSPNSTVQWEACLRPTFEETAFAQNRSPHYHLPHGNFSGYHSNGKQHANDQTKRNTSLFLSKEPLHYPRNVSASQASQISDGLLEHPYPHAGSRKLLANNITQTFLVHSRAVSFVRIKVCR